MIKYSLQCDMKHEFEGWFRSADDFERQADLGVLSCPTCGSGTVTKTLMAPAVSTSRKKTVTAMVAQEEQQRQMVEALKELRNKVTESADYVGDKFAEEARRIHYGEVEHRGIYGEATTDEARELIDEGVDFMPLPELPEDRN
ncbi:DUF1178 family protein [Coralliovum pocilloporae]|uniref:DUF1178 family protein n=1 Tax=Coralliovum pocilloporae TaxID=3066369 RepID=UPI003307176F